MSSRKYVRYPKRQDQEDPTSRRRRRGPGEEDSGDDQGGGEDEEGEGKGEKVAWDNWHNLDDHAEEDVKDQDGDDVEQKKKEPKRKRVDLLGEARDFLGVQSMKDACNSFYVSDLLSMASEDDVLGKTEKKKKTDKNKKKRVFSCLEPGCVFESSTVKGVQKHEREAHSAER